MSENITVVIKALPFILQGLAVTMGLVLEALFLGLVIGLSLAVGQVYGNRWISGSISLYVWFFRGLPNLVLLFLFYFGLFPLLGLNVSAFMIAGARPWTSQFGLPVPDFQGSHTIPG